MLSYFFQVVKLLLRYGGDPRQSNRRGETALKVANSHYSFKSSEDAGQLFKRMFPDSQIATQFGCGENKCAYLCSFGLAPYFKSLTLSNLLKQRACHSVRRNLESLFAVQADGFAREDLGWRRREDQIHRLRVHGPFNCP